MPPKKEPAETADVAVASDKEINARKAAYESGFADGESKGYKAGYADGLKIATAPKGVFDAARREVVKIRATSDNDALHQIDEIMANARAQFPDEKMPRSDREILLQVWRQVDASRRADRNAARAPRNTAPTGPPNVEYEVVT